MKRRHDIIVIAGGCLKPIRTCESCVMKTRKLKRSGLPATLAISFYIAENAR
jgi:hypothetical protein